MGALAYLYEKMGNGVVKCKTCEHYCTIQEGKTGICGIRENKGGKLYLTTYPYPSSIAIDPIEKKPLYKFHPDNLILSYATIGCNMKCPFCQNHEISQPKAVYAPYGKILPERVIHIAKEKNIPFLAATYTEPTVFLEYSLDIMKLAKEENFYNVWVTNGFFSKETFELIAPYLDAANVDLKTFSDKTYKKFKGKLEPVLRNIKMLYDANIHIEITTLLIPTVNDSDDEIESIAKFIHSIDPEIPWHINRFFPKYKWNHLSPTPIDRLIKAKEIGDSVGLKNVYLGNV